ncbi:MAG: cathepsin X [Bacillariaceae sp.]|jgi:cathepsin X
MKNHVGSCKGGSVLKLYRFIKEESGMIPYDTCMPYIACSDDSTEGFCPYVNTTCSPINTCRTCDTFIEHGGTCREIDIMPNATISEYGYYNREDFIINNSNDNNNRSDNNNNDTDLLVKAVKAEIFARGPVVTALNGHALADYVGK